jgi:hypothetical protein
LDVRLIGPLHPGAGSTGNLFNEKTRPPIKHCTFTGILQSRWGKIRNFAANRDFWVLDRATLERLGQQLRSF